jgi:uncharacterized protein (DUF1778 family)
VGKSTKSKQLQIRVSHRQKTAIQRAAANAGMDMSGYVLSRVLASTASRFCELAAACVGAASRFALAELNSFLSDLTVGNLRDAVAEPPPQGLTPYILNYIAAMVEQACARRGVAVPAWASETPPLTEPVFASVLMSLRLHLLTHSPPAFRRRNIFIDSSLGDRI